MVNVYLLPLLVTVTPLGILNALAGIPELFVSVRVTLYFFVVELYFIFTVVALSDEFLVKLGIVP